jgi:hypothetical protein
MDLVLAFPPSEIAADKTYRFIYERIIDRLRNLAAAEEAPENEHGTFFTVEQVTNTVSDYSREMWLAVSYGTDAYHMMAERIRQSTQDALLSTDGCIDVDVTNWRTGLNLAAKSFYNPIHAELMRQGNATGGYINVKEPAPLFAPCEQEFAEHLYGEN